MPDHTDEEHIDNPTNIQSDNLSDEITPTNDSETITKNQEPENMEVHKHPHHVTHKKKWGEYLLEFVMLFLAVFLGFVAENIREHQVEHKREKEYIASLIKDVELDTASLHLTYNIRKKYINYFDSLVFLLKQNEKSKLNDIYFYARFLGRIKEFKYHDRTIQQLKSSGSLRLIRNRKVADSITIYDNEAVKLILNQQDIERKVRDEASFNMVGKIFNAWVWNDMVDTSNLAEISRPTSTTSLITTDEKLINEFAIKVVYLKTAYRLTNGNIEETIKTAENLLSFLKTEYEVE